MQFIDRTCQRCGRRKPLTFRSWAYCGEMCAELAKSDFLFGSLIGQKEMSELRESKVMNEKTVHEFFTQSRLSFIGRWRQGLRGFLKPLLTNMGYCQRFAKVFCWYYYNLE